MKKITLILMLLALNSCLIGSGDNSKIIDNGNNRFPSITGIDLEGKERSLPKTFSEKYNILAIGFEREHQEAINTWIKVIDDIITNNNDVKFFEIPVIYELGKFSRAWINNGMRFGIQDEIARKRTITVYTKREEFFKIMNMKGDRIYVIIVDNKGNIIWRSEGIASEDNIKSLQKFLKSNYIK